MRTAETPTTKVELANIIRDAAVFCFQYGGHLFRGWSGDKLFKYLAFHALNQNLLITRANHRLHGVEISGLLIAWSDFAPEILRREARGEPHFNWQLPKKGGDAYLLADIIVTRNSPLESRNSLTRLVEMASQRWPDWKMRRLFTHRRGQLVELSPELTTRFLHVFA